MPNEKRILIVSGLQIFPPQSGGQLRTANVARQLSQAGSVEIYSMTGRKADYQKRVRSGTTTITPRLEEFVNRSKLFGLLQFLAYRLKVPPFWLWFLTFGLLPRSLRTAIRNADEVVIDFPYLYPVLRHAKGRRILNTHNLEYRLWSGGIARAVRAIERRAVLKCDEVWCCSEAEARELREMGGGEKPVVVVPNWSAPIARSKAVGLEVRATLGIPESARVILFSASQYAPNQEAFRFLVEFSRAHDSLLRQLDAFLLVVGSVSASAHHEGRCVATGPVPEVGPYFSAADWAINPVTSGSGTSLKMVEYRAAGLPILSTAFGARGLGFVEGVDFKPFEREELGLVLSQELRGAIHESAN